MTLTATHPGFRHEVLLYAGEDDFALRTGDFVREAVEAGEAVLVVVGASKISRLRELLGPDGRAVHFVDMSRVGRNPARIISVWHEFVANHAPRAAALRGVGEPVDAARDAASLVECERHEAVLNVAFDDEVPWSLLCPYDTDTLAPAVIEEALRNHPYVRNGGSRVNPEYRGRAACAAPSDHVLPQPPPGARTFAVALEALHDLRETVGRHAARHGFDGQRVDGFVLAVHELATNSIRHGGGGGKLRLWGDETEIVAEVRDAGRIVDPLAGRIEPDLQAASGRGLWLANQLCDLVQIRAHTDGGVVRVHLRTN